ncbi:MAG: fatty acid desaturase, partial [Flavobacteriales bacterium]|nr:fatty acid desaturase [Flavobacteriales bacterium]
RYGTTIVTIEVSGVKGKSHQNKILNKDAKIWNNADPVNVKREDLPKKHMMKIRFTEDEGHHRQLRTILNSYMRDRKVTHRAGATFFAKAALIVFLLGMFYVVIMTASGTAQLVAGYVGYSTCMILYFLNVLHDAAHDTVFKRAAHNRWLFSSFYLFGTSPWLWKTRHVHSHHNYANIPGTDVDIRQFRGVRITPADRHEGFQKWQHWYMPILYLLYTLYWLMVRDFRDFGNGTAAAVSRAERKKQFVYMLLAKFFYFGYILLLPSLLFPGNALTVVVAFVVGHLVASALAAIALLSAHVGENALFVMPDEHGRIPHSWFTHQVVTTTDFGRGRKWVSFVFGGFNLHLCHHLFPGINHTRYDMITPVI